MKKKLKQSWDRSGPFYKMALLLFAGLIVLAAVLIAGNRTGVVTGNTLLFLLFTGYVTITIAAAALAAVDTIVFHPDGRNVHDAADFRAESEKAPLSEEKNQQKPGEYELAAKKKRPIRYAAAALICAAATVIVVVLILNIVTVSGMPVAWILMRRPLLNIIICIFAIIVIGNPLLHIARRHHAKKYYRVMRIAETAEQRVIQM